MRGIYFLYNLKEIKGYTLAGPAVEAYIVNPVTADSEDNYQMLILNVTDINTGAI